MDDTDYRLQHVPDVQELIRESWNTSTRTGCAYNYLAGLLDALRWANRLTFAEYDSACSKLLKLKSGEEW